MNNETESTTVIPADEGRSYQDWQSSSTKSKIVRDVQGLSRFMSAVYMWLMMGVVCMGVSSYIIASNPHAVEMIIRNSLVFWGIIIAQFALVFSISWVERISTFMLTGLYVAYTALTGVTLSLVFLMYTMDSVINVFFITGVAFFGLSMVGYTTKRDLGALGTFCTMGLFGLIGIMVLQMLMPSLQTTASQQIISICGLIIFAGFTAYDTKRIKEMYLTGYSQTTSANGQHNAEMVAVSEDTQLRLIIRSALMLYLDFINLLLNLLRLLGNRR